jgi:DinB family protein
VADPAARPLPCSRCRFDWTDGPTELIAALGSAAARFAEALTVAGEARVRPAPDVWSPLEYVAHTRDALAWYEDRIRRVLVEDCPQLNAYDWDAAAVERRYNDEEPSAALASLAARSYALGERLSALEPSAWHRLGRGSDGGERSVLQLVRRAVHEVAHHVGDIRASE